MIISCPKCQVKYDIPSTYFANGQRRVRCSNCAFEWKHRDPNSQQLQSQEAYRDEADEDPDIGEGFEFYDGALTTKPIQSAWVRRVETPQNRRIVIVALAVCLLACFLYVASNAFVRAIPPAASLYRWVGIEPVFAMKQWNLCFTSLQTPPDSRTVPSPGRLILEIHNQSSIGRIFPGTIRLGDQQYRFNSDENLYFVGDERRTLSLKAVARQSVTGGALYLQEGNAKRPIPLCAA